MIGRYLRSGPGVLVRALIVIGFALPLCVTAASAQGAPYLGSEACSACHLEVFNDFRLSGHPYKLVPASEAQLRPIPLPEGFRWSDISYVIGGYKWKARFMGLDGYIITAEKDGDLGMNQYNFLTGRWVDYNAGKLKPYDCGRCHTTGFTPDVQPGGPVGGAKLAGIIGTWELPGIQCEACHGPSARGPDGTGQHGYIDRSSALCGSCHVRGATSAIPASGGFIRHHEQYNETLASPHVGLSCVDCHNPHRRSAASIVTTCSDCHASIAASYTGTVMDEWGVTCEDCHMPMASKSADALGPFKGDVRTHLFQINTDPDGQLFTSDGSAVALTGAGRAAVTLDFACLSCHTTETRRWAALYARNFHGLEDQQVPTPRKPKTRVGLWR